MRQYAFLLLALFAVAARAATIPDAPQTEKKLDSLPENTDAALENVSSDQELIDQASTINDVDNKLRAKPEDIPVEVVVENVQPVLKTIEENTDSEEIIRQPIDLRNPGPPQRQEHETQNPEFYAAEQQIVQVYKQNINEAQTVLKQGFQDVSDGLRKLFENKEKTKSLQKSILTLQEDFTSQINKLNGTIQTYVNSENVKPVEQQTKAGFQQVDYGLNDLKTNFNNGMKTLAEGVQVISFLKDINGDGRQDAPTTGSSVQPSEPVAPVNPLINMMNNFQNSIQNSFRNITQVVANIMNPQNSENQQTSQNVPAGAQADTSATTTAPQPGPFPWNNIGIQSTQNNPFTALQTLFTQFQNQVTQLFSGTRPGQPGQAGPTEQPTESHPAPPGNNENKPVANSNPAPTAATTTTIGPIRQILQNNPISQGITFFIDRVQGKPESTPQKVDVPTKPVQENLVPEGNQTNDKPKGHRPAESDNNDGSGVEPSASMKESQSEPLPEIQEPVKVEVEDKPEKVDDKTE